MNKIYCGNNALDPELLAGDIILGTRYTCLKRGIGKGLHLPLDQKYTRGYEPIDKRRIYCGNKAKLPKGYYSMGNLPQCLQKGIGIGKKKKSLLKRLSTKSRIRKSVKKSRSNTKSRIRKSVKKSRARKPCKSNQVRNRTTKRCRNKSTLMKSSVRKSVMKSSVRKSVKKSRVRKSVKKSRVKKSRVKKSVKKSRTMKSSTRKSRTRKSRTRKSRTRKSPNKSRIKKIYN